MQILDVVNLLYFFFTLILYMKFGRESNFHKLSACWGDETHGLVGRIEKITSVSFVSRPTHFCVAICLKFLNPPRVLGSAIPLALCQPYKKNGSRGGEPFKHFSGLVTETNFLVSAVLGTLAGYCAEGLDEGGVLGAVHYVGGEVLGDVDELGCAVGCEVGREVGAFADGGASGLDGVVEEVGALIVCEVVGFFDFAREVVAEDLLEVLSVVGVGSFDIGKCDGCHSGQSLSFSSVLL